MDIQEMLNWAKQKLMDKGYTGGGELYSVTLEEHLRDDYGWQAIATVFDGPDMDNLVDKSVRGWGENPAQAIVNLVAEIEKMPAKS